MTIHYHGTPVTPTELLLEHMAGAHFCVSFAQPQQVEQAHRVGQSVMLDNGAFSVWRRGIEIDWSAYYAWAERWLERPTTWAVIPDVIAGTDADQDELLRQWPHGRRKGAPVWHMHELIDRLVRLLDEYPRVCIGSSGLYRTILSDPWQHRMDKAWRAINARHRWTPDVHMLRGMQLIRHRWPFASVDSADVARNHSAKQNSVPRMVRRWDAGQCPARFICPGEQHHLFEGATNA